MLPVPVPAVWQRDVQLVRELGERPVVPRALVLRSRARARVGPGGGTAARDVIRSRGVYRTQRAGAEWANGRLGEGGGGGGGGLGFAAKRARAACGPRASAGRRGPCTAT